MRITRALSRRNNVGDLRPEFRDGIREQNIKSRYSGFRLVEFEDLFLARTIPLDTERRCFCEIGGSTIPWQGINLSSTLAI
jgi:hypothetical protein